MIYRAIQLIQIFCAHGRAGGLTKVIQEVLADLKIHFIYSFMTAEKDVQVARKRGGGYSGIARKKTFIFIGGLP